jgi:hypothetical protein
MDDLARIREPTCLALIWAKPSLHTLGEGLRGLHDLPPLFLLIPVNFVNSV